MGFDRTLVFTLAVEFLILAGLTWAVGRVLDRRARRREQDRRVAVIIADLDSELDDLFREAS